MTVQSNQSSGDLYGGLLLNVSSAAEFSPIEYPFAGLKTAHGNHVRPYDQYSINSFDFWHSGSESTDIESFVPERGIKIHGKMIGHDCEPVLRRTVHNILTVNSGVKLEERDNMLDAMANLVLPKIVSPAFISIELQSSQPKFILFSRDMPIYMNVFCDDSSYLLMWSNDRNLEQNMRDHYGNRFVVYRMNPIVNAVCVLHTFYLKKKFGRWKYDFRDRLKVLNALEGLITRRSKSDNT